MADYDSNIIRPVQSLQNITGLGPAKRREERRRRNQSHQEHTQEDESSENKQAEPEIRTEIRNERTTRKIDYCA